MMRYLYDSPLGMLTLLSDGRSITGLYFPDQAGMPTDKSVEDGKIDAFYTAKIWLDAYFCGKVMKLPPPVFACGTAFQERVWHSLQEIPYGEVTTYGILASKLSTSARAIGRAVGHNPISILIPCHRVIGADGSLTGYAGGLERKRFLLTLESTRSSLHGLDKRS